MQPVRNAVLTFLSRFLMTSEVFHSSPSCNQIMKNIEDAGEIF